MGFGAGLPMKFSGNATVQALIEAGFDADLDIIEGNSGGPIIDLQTHTLVGVVSNDLPVDDFFQAGNCFRPTRCPDDPVCVDGFTSLCGVTYAPFNAAIRTVATPGGGSGGGATETPGGANGSGGAAGGGENGTETGDAGDVDELAGAAGGSLCASSGVGLLALSLAPLIQRRRRRD